jgi:signal transduction histidine kinase
LQKTVEQLLALSRIESGEVRRNFERINLSYIAREAVETYGSVFQVKGIALAVTAPAEAPAMGSSLLIGQMVANLLDNAARLTPADGRVDVGIHPAANGGWLLDVADSGPGIPVQDRQTVFEAFSQGSHPDQRGTGLGLAIVAEIARVHAGSVSADASPSGGALIRVALPHVISAASP